MKITTSILLASIAVAGFADENWTTNTVHYLGSGTNRLEYIIVTNANGKAVKKFKPGEIKQRIHRYNGGFVEKPGTGTGKICFVSSQNSISNEKIAEFIKFISLEMHIKMDLSVGDKVDVSSAAAAMAKSGAKMAIFLIEDDILPSSLVAYNTGWAIVNVKSLVKDVSDGIADMRVKKEILRTFALLCGAADSNASGTVMWPVREASDLDGLNLPERLPPPFIQSIGKHLVRMGYIPTTVETYRKACEAGWAPKPVNDVQQRIWDIVHETPTDPMRIEYDPKKGK